MRWFLGLVRRLVDAADDKGLLPWDSAKWVRGLLDAAHTAGAIDDKKPSVLPSDPGDGNFHGGAQ